MPVDRRLSVIYLLMYRAADERERDRFDENLTEIPEEIRDRDALTRGRRPRNWGPGDDDDVEANAGREALAFLARVQGGPPLT